MTLWQVSLVSYFPSHLKNCFRISFFPWLMEVTCLLIFISSNWKEGSCRFVICLCSCRMWEKSFIWYLLHSSYSVSLWTVIYSPVPFPCTQLTLLLFLRAVRTRISQVSKSLHSIFRPFFFSRTSCEDVPYNFPEDFLYTDPLALLNLFHTFSMLCQHYLKKIKLTCW